MIQLLVIYFSALAVFTFVPTKVSSYPFINLSQSIQFEIDPNSPAISIEKDLLEEMSKPAPKFKTMSLNSVVGKAYEPQRTIASQTKKAVIDYSQNVRLDRLAELTISGPLELKQGLALTDEHRIEIHRENKGSIVEFGDVDIQKGTYAIKLSSFDGHVCARLRGSRYEIIGEGCFSLERIKGLNKSTTQGPLLSVSRYQDVLAFSDKPTQAHPQPLKLAQLEKQVKGTQLFRAPTSRQSAKARIIDFYDSDNPEAKPLNVNIDTAVGNAEDTSSTVVTYFAADKYPQTILLANAYTHSRGLQIPRENTVNNYKKIVADVGALPPNSQDGIVWGKASREGMTLAGAQVSVEGRDDVQPLYLNEFYIPDPNQKATASHGIYTIPGLPEGEYSIRATLNNQFLGFQNVSVRENALSIGDIDSTERKRTVKISLYDLLNKTSQDAVVTLQNYEEDVVVEEGQAEVNVQDNYDTAFAMVNPLNKKYMTTQFILNPKEELYNFPMVSSEWVESILSQAKLERAVKNKLVLGLGAGKPFRVEAVGSKTAQVIYFDSQGQVIEGNYGQAGGGFFILDPEDSVNQYAIQAAGEKSVRAVYMPTIPNVLNIIQL